MKEIIKKQIEKIDIAELTSKLIQIPSYSFMKDQEKEVAEFINNFFEKEGVESRLVEIRPGRYNVYAQIKGYGNGKSLMLSGHIDTVPPYDMVNPFDGIVKEGKVFGRGACDMKGPIASMMATMVAVKRSGIKLKGDLMFSGLADEEEQGRGVEHLIQENFIADATIMGEPTNMKISVGHKGLEWIKVTIKGKKVHGGDSENGINAIEMAARFVNKIYSEYVPVLNSRKHPILGVPTINIATIKGGDQPSTVPDECIISLDRRCVPSESIQQVYSELRQIASQLKKEDSRFEAIIDDIFATEEEPMLPHTPFCTDENDEFVVAIKSAIALEGREGIINALPCWSDAGPISAQTDSKCVVMGPGSLSVAHTVHEYIDIEELYHATNVYTNTALEYCEINA